MSDYIELGPDDVIREGDEQKYCGDLCKWFPVYRERIGFKAKHDDGWVFRRPRSTVIRDAAIELLRDVAKYGTFRDSEEKLREAIGISVEELRGEA